MSDLDDPSALRKPHTSAASADRSRFAALVNAARLAGLSEDDGATRGALVAAGKSLARALEDANAALSGLSRAPPRRLAETERRALIHSNASARLDARWSLWSPRTGW